MVLVFTTLQSSIAVFPSKVTAKTLLYSEDFSEPDALESWLEVRNQQWSHPLRICMNGSQPARWTVNQGTAEIFIDSNPCTMEIIPPDFLLPASQTYEFEADVTFLESVQMDRNILFLWIDAGNWYDVKVTGTEVRLQKVVNGQVYQLENSVTTFPFVENQTYHFSVVFSRSGISVSIDDSLLLESADSEPFPENNFFSMGLQAGVGSLRRTASRFDNLAVYRLQQDPTSVTRITQHDPSWGELIYDHADQWSTTGASIKHWGCALTSLVMIMQYHGITTMPDGNPLNPATVNDWLTQQPDGYIGGGLLNFLAGTRLTKQISHLYGSPTLEYGRKSWSTEVSMSDVRQEVESNKPVILQIPGHFFVSDDYDQLTNDFLIKDPAYIYTHLNQHTTTPISYRTFQPSFTDLSYLMVTHDENENIIFTQKTTGVESISITESLTSFETTDTNSTAQTTTSVQIPDEGEYTVTLLTPQNEYHVELFSYTKDGEVTIHQLSGNSMGLPVVFALEYKKDAPSTIAQVGSFERLQQLLETAYAQTEHFPPLTWWWLDHTTKLAIENPASNRYFKQLFLSLLEYYEDQLGENLLTELQTEVSIIPE